MPTAAASTPSSTSPRWMLRYGASARSSDCSATTASDDACGSATLTASNRSPPRSTSSTAAVAGRSAGRAPRRPALGQGRADDAGRAEHDDLLAAGVAQRRCPAVVDRRGRGDEAENRAAGLGRHERHVVRAAVHVDDPEGRLARHRRLEPASRGRRPAPARRTCRCAPRPCRWRRRPGAARRGRCARGSRPGSRARWRRRCPSAPSARGTTPAAARPAPGAGSGLPAPPRARRGCGPDRR